MESIVSETIADAMRSSDGLFPTSALPRGPVGVPEKRATQRGCQPVAPGGGRSDQPAAPALGGTSASPMDCPRSALAELLHPTTLLPILPWHRPTLLPIFEDHGAARGRFPVPSKRVIGGAADLSGSSHSTTERDRKCPR